MFALLWLLSSLVAFGCAAPSPAALLGARPARAAAVRDVAQRPAVHAPAILAKSAYLLDAGSGEALFQKFPTTRRPMASTTKLMTGLLTAESGRLDESATVSRAAAVVGETTMGLVQGERVPVGELLYGLLMNSGNDAAIALAEHLGGSVAGFADQMNARAAELGLTDTHYVNPHGLDNGPYYSPEHYSSARDLAVLLAFAMQNPTFARADGTLRREVPAGPVGDRPAGPAGDRPAGPAGDRPAGPVGDRAASPAAETHRLRHTISALWWYPGALAGKTGWTERAGQVRAVLAERSGTRLVAVVMDSPDDVGETRDLLDYGFAISASAEAQRSVPLAADAFPLPEPRLQQAWATYKRLALAPDGRVRRGAAGDETTSDAQAAALLHAVWFRDRETFDAVWRWTKGSLSRQRSTFRDPLFGGRWARGAVTDWNNSTAADERLAAALLLASKLWDEPPYRQEAKPILDALLNKAAISWPGPLSMPTANTFLKDLEPATTSGTALTPAFYRMFAEGGRNSVWLWLLDGSYEALDRAASGAGPLGPGVGLLPAWFSVGREQGQVGAPVDPSWQSTGFGDASPALAWQLALDVLWSGDARARNLLAPTAKVLGNEMALRQRLAATYSRAGFGTGSAETAAYGALAGIVSRDVVGPQVAVDPKAEQALRGKLEAALGSGDADRVLDGIDGVWLLAGGPPNFWRLWTPPADLPTTRNDAVVPPAEGDTAGAPATWRYFSETGHVVQGRFLEFFNRYGGVGTFGLPRTEQLAEEGRMVQYFQRARLEYFPEREGAGAEVVVPAALGSAMATARGILSRPEARPVAAFESDDQRLFVAEMGHSVFAGFKVFYEKNGGAAVLGRPLTEELSEDGFTVQYFERAVLEFQPGKTVQAELVGDEALRAKGWLK